MKQEAYAKALKFVAIGYLLILLNLNLGSIDLLADWMGYMLFYDALDAIGSYEKSATLLKPLAVLLGIYEGIVWCLSWVGIGIDHYIIHVIILTIHLYFDFQLLTNITDIAQKHHSSYAAKIRRKRNMITVLLTVMAFPIDWKAYEVIMVIYVLITLAVDVALCSNLFGYAKEEQSLLDEW